MHFHDTHSLYTQVAVGTIFAINGTATSTSTTKPSTLTPAATNTILPSTATSTGSTNKATESLIGLHVCDKALTISSILHNLTVTHASAADCTTGDHRSSEALVLKSCNSNSTATWIKGENVMELCNRIPLLTPIATFTDNVYYQVGGKAGIFLGCLPDGFKIAVQECHAFTQIKHLQSGAFGVNDPSNYFVIRW
ncbi:hypothetical protein CHS0354_024986 [Potamilus streckersoni]|uniref:Uncharacterized protein n=1 Tax=Potamilus streckersoni TaxID=2493646 RepID=A0AAE0T3M4_9BIVA|nr:hypothetical protein CHS0354_024986 [Potamilus streckersoni]